MRIPTPGVSVETSVAATPSSVATDSKRRRFLFTLGLGSAGVAVSANASASAMAEATDPAQQDDADGRYRETEHVRDYYRTAKL